MDANSLRQAAYLLVAHFVVVTGFSLLGTAPLDYGRVLMMLAFLAGAVAVLFRPWKMGWVMIVLYAWHAANPSLLWLWSLWTSPELQPGAKLGRSMVLALLHTPLAAALVMVFRPSGFAAFKAAAMTATAAQGKPVAGSSAKPVETSVTVGRPGRFALISVGVLLVSMVAVLAVLPREWMEVALVVWLFLLVYVPLTPFALRVKLRSTTLRYFFGLTAMPVFAVTFIWLLHRLFTEFPVLSETFSAAMARGGRNAGMGHMVIVVIPAVILFAAWYWAIRLLDRGLERLGRGTATTLAAAIVLTFLGGILYVAHDAGIIGSAEWRMSRRTYGGAAPNKEWMREAQLQQESKRWWKTWYYPRSIEGQCHDNVERYRVEWKVLDADQRYYYYWGLERSVYEGYDRDLRARGYGQESVTRFRDCAGNEKYQATWTTRVRQ